MSRAFAIAAARKGGVLYGFVACRANDQHAQTPTPSADAADPPHRGAGMQANDLNYRGETPAVSPPPCGEGKKRLTKSMPYRFTSTAT
jgi:hypothetical protein